MKQASVPQGMGEIMSLWRTARTKSKSPAPWPPADVVRRWRQEGVPDPTPEQDERKAVELAKFGVPELYRSWRYPDFPWLRTNPPEKLQGGILDWSGEGLFLRGVNGSGKSCFAAAALRSMLQPSHPRYLAITKRNWDGSEYRAFDGAAQWWYSVDLADYMLTMKFTNRSQELWRELMRPKVVVLDDFGKERIESPPVREALVQAVQRWLSGGKYLIVTTNVIAKNAGQSDDDALLAHETSIGSRLLGLTEIILPAIDRRQP